MRSTWAIHLLQGTAADRTPGEDSRHWGLLLRQDLAGLGAGLHWRITTAMDRQGLRPDPGESQAVLPA